MTTCGKMELSTHRFLVVTDNSKMHELRKLAYAIYRKVQVGKDQEKAQSEKDSHSKNQGGKKPNQQSGTYTMKTYRKRDSFQ